MVNTMCVCCAGSEAPEIHDRYRCEVVSNHAAATAALYSDTILVHRSNCRSVQGLYGRLGDLGSIDKQYDAAVSNATGTLDNLVIDTTVHAQQCVEHLRKHDLGVATFLILEKQAHLARHVDTKVQTPEGIPRLFDLVKCNRPELRPAFFFAFRHTLVANDIDQASRIGHGSKDPRFSRVVTMQV